MAERPIIVELRGRLGNQLFEYAAGYAVALRTGTPLLFSSRRLKRLEPLELPRVIPDLYREATTGELLRRGRFEYDVPGRRAIDELVRAGARALGALRGVEPTIEQRGPVHVFDRRVVDARPPCILRGVFPSERYFADRAADIAARVRLPDATALLPADVERPLVGVSFRRGDFNALGWSLPLGYYDSALEQLCDKVTPATLVVFSDDAAFSELVITRLARFGRVVDGLTSSSDPVDNLAVLATCDHSVIANSTFSWWGAWLGDHRPDAPADRMVLAPTEWQRRMTGDDTVPERWHGVTWEGT